PDRGRHEAGGEVDLVVRMRPHAEDRAEIHGGARYANASGGRKRAIRWCASEGRAGARGLPGLIRQGAGFLAARDVRRLGRARRSAYAATPKGRGSQKLTNRYPITATTATARGAPNGIDSATSVASITPRPPGVMGMAAITFAIE